MSNLFLLRHGETELSRQDRFCGRMDVALTAAGREMAHDFAAAYVGIPWRAIYTSTRRRAVHTAAPLAALAGLPITEDARLDEIDYGDWQGLGKDEIRARDPERYRRWCEDPRCGAPGGERIADVAARVRAALADITAAHPSDEVLVVSHKTVLRVALCELLGVDLRRYRTAVAQPVGGVSLVEVGVGLSDARLRLLGDTSHLGQGAETAALDEVALPALPPLAGAPATVPADGGGAAAVA